MSNKIYDYHNNNVVAELDSFLKDQASFLYTDWELLCKVAKIVEQRKAPSSEMTDCSTGLQYSSPAVISAQFEAAMHIAQRNAGK